MVDFKSANTSTNVNEDNVGPTNASSMPATTTSLSASMASSTAMLSSALKAVMIPPLTTTNTPVTPRPTMVSQYRSYMPSFTIPPFVGSDFQYGMPTSMMVGFYANPSTVFDNVAAMLSPINTYLASGSAISELS